ncbi:MAG: rhamnogalacturonan lyase [Rikenellaceae bacterium]|nr:rhamnogalacturonan lyase [Rikenellaceae bacterium]
MKFIKPLLFFVLLSLNALAQEQITLKGPNYRADIQKENLGRGLVAIHNGDGIVSVSWRFFESDPIDGGFDLYRKEGRKKEVKLNDEPLTKSTFFRDSLVDVTKTNVYTVRRSGTNETERGAQYTLTPEKASIPYLSIPMQPVDGDHEWQYAPNDASVGDLDGDGELDIVLLRMMGGFDNAHRGWGRGTVLIEAYKMDGTFMWRVDLGPNIRPGAHYTQLLVYDFDGDGKAEVAVKTAEGTIFGDGTVIGDVDGDGRTFYVDTVQTSPTYGKILEGPEFFSVIEGATGKELARADYISRGAPGAYGDSHGNRVNRFLAGVGYFDGERPSMLWCRGYYAKTVLEAWDYRDGKLTKRWTFDTDAENGKYKEYGGQGNHNLRIGDVNGDGKDDITYGSMALDHNGLPLYNTKLGHGDAIHLTDIDIDREGLEVWDCHEEAPLRAGSELRDAATGELLWGIPSVEDVGRAMAADIDPRFRSVEVWTSSSRGVYTADGRLISERAPSVNMAVWWTGDLNRELLDGGRRGVRIEKWNGDGVDLIPLPDEMNITTNNGTKANPCIQADLFGDWREEIAIRTRDNKEVRIYMTDYETDYRFHTLLHDIIYRLSVATENIAYNQPTQPGFYLGSALGRFWKIRFNLATNRGKQGTAADGRPNGMNARLEGATEYEIRDIKSRRDSYTFDARYNYDTYEWEIEGTGIKGNERYFTVNADQIGYDKTVNVKIKTTLKGCIFEDAGTLTFVKEDPRGNR